MTIHYTVALCADAHVLLIGVQNSQEPLVSRHLEVLPVQSAPRRLKPLPWLRDARAKITAAPYKRTLRDHRQGVFCG